MMLKLLPGWSVAISGSSLSISSDVRCFKVDCRFEAPEAFADALKTGFSLGSEERFEGERALVGELIERKLIAPEAENKPGSISRQAEYFAHLGLDAAQAQERVSSSKILLLGLGGTGSVILEHLVGAGAKRYTLIDQDIVTASNLERQFIYTQQHFGQSKVSAAAEYVLARTPTAHVTTVFKNMGSEHELESVISHFGSPDLAIVCIDQPPISSYQLTANALWRKAIPFLHGGVMIRSGFFGPFFDPQRSPYGPEFFPINVGRQLPQATMCYSPYNTMIAAGMAAEAIHYLAKALEFVDFERRTFLDFYRGRFSKLEPQIAGCGHAHV